MLHSRRPWVRLRQRKAGGASRVAGFVLAGVLLLFLLYKVGLSHENMYPVGESQVVPGSDARVALDGEVEVGERESAPDTDADAEPEEEEETKLAESLKLSFASFKSDIHECAELEKFGERLTVSCSFQYLTHEVRTLSSGLNGVMAGYKDCLSNAEEQTQEWTNPSSSSLSSPSSSLSSPSSSSSSSFSSNSYSGKDLTVVWDMGACGCTGWAFEVISYVLSIHEKVARLGIIAGEDCFCAGLPDATLATLTTLRTQPIEAWDAEPRSNGGIDVFISHKPPGRYPVFPYWGAVTILNRPRFVVGRSMAEVDLVPQDWAARVKAMTDELWVPAAASLDAFLARDASLTQTTFVVPETFDETLYHVLPASAQAAAKRAALPLASGFHFFSSFKWEKRKGWDVLIRAFVEEFRASEDVTLYVKSYMPEGSIMYAGKHIRTLIREFVAELDLGDDGELPLNRIHVISEETPQRDMPALYGSMDCFVLPTRGEGWGLPLMESMAMGLPTVATAWGGQTEFMNGLNSYLVDVEDFVQAEEGANWLHGQKWAEPSLAHLRSVMRYVFSNKAQAQAKGRRAAADVRKRFGMKPVADILMARLDSIAKQLSERHETIRGPL